MRCGEPIRPSPTSSVILNYTIDVNQIYYGAASGILLAYIVNPEIHMY